MQFSSTLSSAMRKVALALAAIVAASFAYSAEIPRATANAATGQTRRRVVQRPLSPADWIRANSIILKSDQLVDDDSDLAPLAQWTAAARIVAIGDSTHGTHEYYTMKQRLVNFLAREHGFTTIAIEGPWPECNRLTDYLQSGDGDPAVEMESMRDEGWYFWGGQEMRDFIAWARSYNVAHPDRPPLRLVGIDMRTRAMSAKNDVLRFLADVDPVAAATATTSYNCTRGNKECVAPAKEVFNNLLRNQETYTARSSSKRFREAFVSARIAAQNFEYWSLFLSHASGADEFAESAMASNASDYLDNDGNGAKMILWGHNEHMAKDVTSVSEDARKNTVRSIGSFLKERYGSELFVIGSSFLNGSYTAFTPAPENKMESRPVEEPAADNYEVFIREAGEPRLIMRTASPLPDFFSGAHRLREGWTNFVAPHNSVNIPMVLPDKFDALLYLTTTTPALPLP